MEKKKSAKYGTVNGKKHKIAKSVKGMKVGEMVQGKKAEKGFKNPPKLVKLT
jgi:hypothetical protein